METNDTSRLVQLAEYLLTLHLTQRARQLHEVVINEAMRQIPVGDPIPKFTTTSADFLAEATAELVERHKIVMGLLINATRT